MRLLKPGWVSHEGKMIADRGFFSMFCLCNIARARIGKTCVSFVDELVFSCVLAALVYTPKCSTPKAMNGPPKLAIAISGSNIMQL